MAANNTILVVEDHDILREGLQILLESEGYRVVAAAHGGEGLQLMEIQPPDLILSDISMPEMDGYTFYDCVRSRAEWIAIPFIFLTALGDRDTMFASKRLGVEDYLVKPVDRSELVAAIRSRLERNQQLMLAELHTAYETTLIMLANAIELRDRYTRGHVERVMKYSLLIAGKLELPSVQMRSLRFGAILHDIGKIYIAESILSKPEPLNEDEWLEMRQHPVIGADLVRSIPYLSSALPVIRSHHERWDGWGYPEGLVGDEIPLGARIVSVADCYDAMTTDRAYHVACTSEQAVEEIIKGNGKRYDPRVVDAFLSIRDQL